jgi:hypothetical protein
MILATSLGTACAWTVNYSRFGHREGRFGPFSMDGDVTPENVMEILEAGYATSLGRVELPAGSDHDFGVMAPGTTGEHSFVVKNVGEGDLSLRIGASSCKCTIGSLDADSIAPGEETEVKLEWTVAADGTSPTFTQNAQLLTNDPAQYAITLNISGKVIGDMEVMPDKWSFGEVATGEPFELSGKIYSYYEDEVVPTDMMFSDELLNDFAEFQVEPFQPGEDDGLYSKARQGFQVTIKLKEGLRQGAVSQNFMFGFRRKGEDGKFLAPSAGDDDENDYAIAPVTGRIVGSLGMIAGPRVKGTTGGGYIYDFGRIGKDDPLIGKSFVVLKGSERDNTTLSVGEISPEGMLKARLGEPTGRGSMTLYPLEIEVVPGDQRIDLLGKNQDDYGNVWIESDNPKVTKMRIAVKFAVDPR